VTIRVEVRCCCKPDNLEGWLEMDRMPEVGDYVLPVPTPLPNISRDESVEPETVRIEVRRHRIDRYRYAPEETYLESFERTAIVANDEISKLPNFIPNK